MSSVVKTSGLLALLLFGTVDAFWRMNCAVIQTGRVDPLVNPGAVAAHAHTIVGGSNIGVNATYDSLVNSKCSSCEIGDDKSAYWTPILYYSYPNGSFLEVPHSGSVIYYLARGPNVDSIIPYPEGFKILTGDKGARSYDNVTMSYGTADYPGRPIADRVTFVCITPTEVLPETRYMANTSCPYGMRAQIVYQSCWNGADLYKADNSHVAYLSGLDNGICPPDHPIQLPTLFIETLWAVGDVPNQDQGGFFVFSQGDATGYGFHADFQNGWVADTLANATANCLVPDNFGQISLCPALQATQSDGYPYNCPQQPNQIQEKVEGLLTQLPGCIGITYGPEEAPAASMNCPTNVRAPLISSTQDSVAIATVTPIYGQQFGIPNQEYLGCFNDSAAGKRTLNSLQYSNYSVMTVEFCQTYCMQHGYRLSGVEYVQECHCDNFLNPTAVNGSYQCNWNCGGTMTLGDVQQEVCGGVGYISVFNNTNTSFVAFGDNTNTGGNAQQYSPPAPFASNYLGCYYDNITAGRTLDGPVLNLNNNMTIEACAAFCLQGNNGLGYEYYGLEFATQCYCGSALSNGGALLTPTSTPTNDTCQMRCPGSEPEICGGYAVLSLYNSTSYISPVHKRSIGRYKYQGCLADPATNGRALQPVRYLNNSLTQESCVKHCLGAGYNYAGMEYGQECYCGNTIVASAGGQIVPCDMSKIMSCAGSLYEYCGGPGFMSLYYAKSPLKRTIGEVAGDWEDDLEDDDDMEDEDESYYGDGFPGKDELADGDDLEEI